MDLLLVLRTEAAVQSLCSRVYVGVGGSISAAIGPLGRHADATMAVGGWDRLVEVGGWVVELTVVVPAMSFPLVWVRMAVCLLCSFLPSC